MEDNVLEIQLLPSFLSTARSMYDDEEIENGDIDSEAVSFQQGANISMMPVEPDNRFEITTDFENGSVSNEDRKYKVMKSVFFLEIKKNK